MDANEKNIYTAVLKAQPESSPDGILVVDQNGKIVSHNSNFAKMWGIPEEILATRSDDAAINTVLGKLSDPNAFLSKVRHLYAHPSESSRDELFLKDGRVFERYSSPLKAAEGPDLGRIWFFRDITQRKNSELCLEIQYFVAKALNEADSLSDAIPRILQALCENLYMDVAELWVLDESVQALKCLDIWHRPIPEFKGWIDESRAATFAPGAGLPGRIWESREEYLIADIETSEEFQRTPSALRAGLRGAFGFPIQIAGSVIGVIQVLSRKIIHPNDELLKALAASGSQIGQFIQRQDSQRALKESQDFVDSIVESAPFMIFVKEAKDLKFVRFNRAGEELLGLKREILFGKSDFDFFPKEQAAFFVGKDREVLAGDAAVDIPEEAIQTANGLRWLHTKKVPIKGPDGKPKFLLGISEDITEKKAAAAKLLEQAKAIALQEQTKKLHDAQEEDARQLAREVHDELGQALACLKIEIESCRKSNKAPALERQFLNLLKTVDSTIADVRRLTMRLRPLILDDLGLEAALDWLREDFARRTGIKTSFATSIRKPINDERQMALFRIAQELLANVARHAKATRVLLTLNSNEKEATLTCSDDGSGIRTPKLGHGIRNMRSRAEEWGGDLTIARPSSGGTLITARIPLPAK